MSPKHESFALRPLATQGLGVGSHAPPPPPHQAPTDAPHDHSTPAAKGSTHGSNQRYVTWTHSHLTASIALCSVLVFMALLVGGITLAASPMAFQPATPQRTYNALVTFVGALCGALLAATVATGVRAHVTGALARRELTLRRYKHLVALANLRVVPDMWRHTPTVLVVALALSLTVNQVVTAVQATFGLAVDHVKYTYPTTLINIDQATSLSLDAGTVYSVNGGPADYDTALNSFGIQLTNPNNQPFLGSVDNIFMPYGWGINAAGPASTASLLRSGYLSGGKGLVLALKSSFGGGVVRFSAPALLPQSTCGPSNGTAEKTAITQDYEEWSLTGACPDVKPVVTRQPAVNALNVSLAFPVSCIANDDAGGANILTTYFSVNPAGNDWYALADCTTTLTSGTVSAMYSESSNEVAVTGWQPATTASLATHTLVLEYTQYAWETSIGVWGSLALDRLLQTVATTGADPSQAWTRIASILYAVSATKVYTVVNSLHGGKRYAASGGGGGVATTLQYSLPVARVGAGGAQAIVLVVFGVALAISVWSLATQLARATWPFDPTDAASVLAVAQNSPAAIEVAGTLAGDPTCARDPTAKLSFGKLGSHDKRVGFSWSEELKPPVVGEHYA